MGNSQPYTLVVSVKIFLRAERSKNSPKELCQMDDSKRGKETEVESNLLWLTSGKSCGVVEEYGRRYTEMRS